MLDYSHRDERYGLMDIAPELMDELIQLRDECKNEGYMECSKCGETVPNNKCEFVDEEMEVCMCTPCARLDDRDYSMEDCIEFAMKL